jgi:hypothetical protein
MVKDSNKPSKTVVPAEPLLRISELAVLCGYVE